MFIKKCSRCNKYKFRWQYNKNRAKKDGLQYQCRPCQHDYHNKKWYPSKRKDHIKSVKMNKLKRRRYNYTKVIEEYFVKGCSDCGERDIQVLEFDHVRGIKRRVGNRCRNCHKKKTWKEQGYYKDLKEITSKYGTK